MKRNSDLENEFVCVREIETHKERERERET